MPERVIMALEQHRPEVKVNVMVHDRPEIDKRLLLSPLVKSLSFGILNATATVGATNQREQYSKLSELKELLVRMPNLQKLEVLFKYNWISRQVTWSGITADPRVLNLPLDKHDRLPSLQDLTFSGPDETYEFDLENCQILTHCMDWSQLRVLNIGISCPQHFFEEIGSRLCSLKSLTMGARLGKRRHLHWHYQAVASGN